MDLFKQYDWSQDVQEVLIDNTFVSDERMVKESSMFLILNNMFHDPFGHFKPHIAKPKNKKFLEVKEEPKKMKKPKKRTKPKKTE